MTTSKDFIQVRTWRTGILVYLQGSQPERTIGWRTDIDGLPIVEQTGLPFASQHQGRMHACGHDFHMTIALGCLERTLSDAAGKRQNQAPPHLLGLVRHADADSFSTRQGGNGESGIVKKPFESASNGFSSKFP